MRILHTILQNLSGQCIFVYLRCIRAIRDYYSTKKLPCESPWLPLSGLPQSGSFSVYTILKITQEIKSL